MDTLFAAAALAFSMLVILWKTGLIHYVLRYQGWLDVVVTVGLFVAFYHQDAITAILIAIFGGLFFSLFMSVLYRLMPHKRLSRTMDTQGSVHWKWIEVPPWH